MNETFLSPEYLSQKKLLEDKGSARLYAETWMLSVSGILLLLFSILSLRLAMSSVSTRGLEEALSAYPGRQATNVRQTRDIGFWLNPFSSRNEGALVLYEALAKNFGEPRRNGPTGEDRLYGADLALRAGEGFLCLSFLPAAFPGGIDELSRSAEDTIGLIGKIFNDSVFEVDIESMSILSESAKSLFNSEVELSTARAMAVLRQFLDAGVDAQRLKVGSFGSAKRGIRGDGKLRSLPPERVDIIISLRK